MERDDRAAVATFLIGVAPAAEETLSLDEAAAHHARVKRLAVGDLVRLTDGAGRLATGSIAAIEKRSLQIAVSTVQNVARPPAIHVRAPIADRDRMLWLAEKATELGATSWQCVRFQRSRSVSTRGEGQAFAEKVRARMSSALEQSGGAWLPEILPDVDLSALDLDATAVGLLLDVDGGSFSSAASSFAAREPVVLFGPEGGIDSSERSALVNRGWRPLKLAPATLRFETAGVAALAVLRSYLVSSED